MAFYDIVIWNWALFSLSGLAAAYFLMSKVFVVANNAKAEVQCEREIKSFILLLLKSAYARPGMRWGGQMGKEEERWRWWYLGRR